MYHPRFKGNHYKMGQKFGKIIKKSNTKFPIHLDEFQREFGMESQKILYKYFPEVIDEVKGVTDIIELDNELFLSWMMCMGCCLDISENDSVEVRGCTAFVYSNGESIYYSRNNDLPPFLKKVSKSIYYSPENGNKFILNTSSFINGEEGINDKGLVVTMTFVCPKKDEIKPGINSVFLVRYILEKCNNVEEGITELKKLPIASSCNILLADKNKNIVVVECSPFKINIRKPIKTEKDNKYIVTVNHFVSEEMWKYDASNRNVFSSETRYRTVIDSLSKKPLVNMIDYLSEILKGKYGFMCQYEKKLNFETIWATIININSLELFIAEGDPRRAKFKIDKRLINSK